MRLWHATGRCFEAVLRIKLGDIVAGSVALRAGLDELLETRFVTRYVTFLAELAEAYGGAGEITNAQAAIGSKLSDHSFAANARPSHIPPPGRQILVNRVLDESDSRDA